MIVHILMFWMSYGSYVYSVELSLVLYTVPTILQADSYIYCLIVYLTNRCSQEKDCSLRFSQAATRRGYPILATAACIPPSDK